MENLDKHLKKLLLKQLLSHCSPARWITAVITNPNNMSRCTDLYDSDFLRHCTSECLALPVQWRSHSKVTGCHRSLEDESDHR